MERFVEKYNGDEFDIIVIGGGITGASVAYEAASRGLSVALIEKNDFASGTSAASSKMIHGGLRYLAKLEIGLVRESLRERRILMNIASNFVHSLPFLYSMYKTDKVPAWMMRVGMIIYEILSFDKSFLWDKSKKMLHYKTLSAKKTNNLVPQARTEGMIGSHLYYDCSNHSPERMTLAFLKSAIKFGAKVSNYAEMTDFIIDDSDQKLKKINGIKVLDKISNKNLVLKSRLIINCGGPWADLILRKTTKTNDETLRRSEGIHFVTKKIHDDYIFAASSKENQHYFIIPYRQHALIGTTDQEYIGNPDNYKVTKDAINGLLEKVNSSFGNPSEPIKYEEITYTYGGLRPLVENQTENVYNSSRKYEIVDEKKHGILGLFTVEGGKFTTSRALAETTIDKAFRVLNKKFLKSQTRHNYLIGCEIQNFSEFIQSKHKQYPMFNERQITFLVKSYGTEIDNLMAIYLKNKDLQEIVNDDGENLSQVVYAIKFEMAVSLSDILLRRTGIGLLGHPGENTLEKIAIIASNYLNWNELQKKEQIEIMNKIFEIPC